MKKMLTLTTLSLITSLTLAVPSQKELEKIITGIHTKTFSVANVYKNPLDTKEWYDVIARTHEFVTEHALHNKSLIKSYKQIKHANDKLIHAIDEAYRLLFKSESTRTVSNQALVDKFSAKFEAIEKEMEALKIKLKKQLDEKKFIIHGQEKVAQVLHRLALTLKTTAVKARNDLKK
jgi:hypothetical protein